MRKLFWLLLFATGPVLGKETPKFPVSALPELLKKDVNVVYREDVSIFKILSRNEATHYVHKAVTILNSKGKAHSQESIEYSKLCKVNYAKGSIYDANGQLIKRLKNTEIIDHSAYDGFSLYSDNRLKYLDLSHGTYPYTIEIEYELSYKYLYSIPSYYLLQDEKTSLEYGKYELHYPTQLKPRYKTFGIIESSKVLSAVGGSESISWEFKEVLPIEREPLGPAFSELIPHIVAAPSVFEYEGYKGDMSSWKSYGDWQNQLNQDKQNLSAKTVFDVKQITGSLSSNYEKTKALYEYLQHKTRYVNIALGIGGLQPFDAKTVDETGYGDCKALSNYMIALLAEAGIKGYYSKIRAGDNAPKIDLDFPSHQTNHIIVMVPQEQDTLWLECTSQTNPFGYLGSFTDNRTAIAITDQGGVVVNTLVYSEQDNTQIRKADVTLTADGNATAHVETIYSGQQYENGNLSSILSDQYDMQKEWVQDNTDIPSFDIKSFSMKNEKEKIPSATVTLDLILNRNASVSGKRIFLTPNLMNRSTYIPEKVENRKTKVVRRMGYIDYDTIQYQIPETIYPEFLPKAIHIESRFGSYDASFTLGEKGLFYVRKMVMKRGEFPAESYSELIEFYKSVNKADHTKIVFLTKT